MNRYTWGAIIFSLIVWVTVIYFATAWYPVSTVGEGPKPENSPRP